MFLWEFAHRLPDERVSPCDESRRSCVTSTANPPPVWSTSTRVGDHARPVFDLLSSLSRGRWRASTPHVWIDGGEELPRGSYTTILRERTSDTRVAVHDGGPNRRVAIATPSGCARCDALFWASCRSRRMPAARFLRGKPSAQVGRLGKPRRLRPRGKAHDSRGFGERRGWRRKPSTGRIGMVPLMQRVYQEP